MVVGRSKRGRHKGAAAAVLAKHVATITAELLLKTCSIVMSCL
jgi:hypothetical protein